MTDKPKTIQEALAEVQRNVDLKEFATGPAFNIAKFGAKQMAATGALAGAAAAASSPKVREKATELYNKGKETVDKLKRAQLPPAVKDYVNTPVKYDADKPTVGTQTSSGHPQNEPASSVFSRIKSGQSPASTPATSGKTEPASAAPKPAETKTETKPADKPVAYDKNKYAIYSKDSDSAKSFRDTFAAQKAAGAETFKWKGGDDVERTYSTKSAPEPKKTESESGGKKKMSEENINELSAFGSAFAAAHKAGKTNFTFGGKSYNTRLASSSPSKPAGPQGAPGLRGPGSGTGGPVARVRDLSAPLPPRRPEQGPPAPKAGSGNETLPVGSGTAPRPNVGEPGGQTSAINAPQTKPPASGGSSNPPTTSGNQTPSGTASFMSQNAREPEYESGKKKKMSEDTNPLIASFLALQEKNPSNMFEAAKKLSKKQDEKLDVVDDDKIDAKDLAALRAGKKHVDEAVLKDPKDPSVQGSGDVTMEPAKPAAPAAAPVHVKPSNPEKLKNLKDPKDPSVQGSGDVTYKEEVKLDEVSRELARKTVMARGIKSHEAEMDYDAPAQEKHLKKHEAGLQRYGKKFGKRAASGLSRSLENKLFGESETEEVIEFSQAEIDHINSFFLEASVAPNRPEVATGADSTSDKMSQNDVTGTAESGKRIRKEEVELDEISKKTYVTAVRSKLDWDDDRGGDASKIIDRAKKYHGDKFAKDLEGVDKDRVRSHGRDKLADKTPVRVTKSGMANKSDLANRKRSMQKEEIERIEEGRPKKNPTPEVTERDPRKHIQVEAGRAAAGNVVDFHHNDGTKSKITPAMGRRITSHLNTLKPADRQAAVNKMHDSAEGLKV